MRRFLYGLGGAIIVLIIIKALREIAGLETSEFMKGWLCCMGFYFGKDGIFDRGFLK